MKLVRRMVPIIAVFFLIGCGTAKPQPKSQTKPQSQSQAQAQSNASQTNTSTSQSSTTTTISTQLTGLSFKWIGKNKDMLSPTTLKPDGKPDGHFHISVPFGQPAALKSIWIRYSEFGKSLKWGWIYDKNLPLVGYMMAVCDSKGKLILPQGDIGYPVNGQTDFDLYISELNNQNGRDTITFGKNQTFNLEIDYVTQTNEDKVFTSSVTIP